jgi:hypothetical protein
MTTLLALVATPAIAHESIAIPVRGHTVTVAYYAARPAERQRHDHHRQGDVGWVGLGSSSRSFSRTRAT